jgi:hyperosmotically inducible periplasmic protein
MSKRLTGLFGGIAAALFVVACAETDAGVTTKVKAKFASDDVVKAYQIDVDTKEHVVTLSGQVENSTAKERAVTLARGTAGVKDVVDNLRVGQGNAALPGEHPTAGTTGVDDKAREAGRDAKEVGGDAKDAAKEAGRDAGNAVSDAAITTAVKSKLLADTTVGGLKIDVDTSNGVVTLNGDVKSAAEKAEAMRIARGTDGVKSVRDNLTIKK